MEFENILYEVQDNILTITLNRPQALNAFIGGMYMDLTKAFDEAVREGRVEKNKLIVEYSLRDMTKPIGVPEYQLTEALPEELADQLPTIGQLEAELSELKDEQEGES